MLACAPAQAMLGTRQTTARLCVLPSWSWNEPRLCEQPTTLAELGNAWPHASQWCMQEAMVLPDDIPSSRAFCRQHLPVRVDTKILDLVQRDGLVL